MPRFSANIGFLWNDLALPDRIASASASGFAGVECHFPYDYDVAEVATALMTEGVKMVGLNTGLGAGGRDDFGVAARPGREIEARELIDQAISYAAALRCDYVSVLAGKTGRLAESESTFRTNLAYACEEAGAHDLTIVIEPLSQPAVANYHVSLIDDAVETIDAVDATNLKLMIDCFHTHITEGDLPGLLAKNINHLGHVQISAVPDRGEPDSGEVDYPKLLAELDSLGYQGWVGAEYTPRTTVEEGLGWLQEYC